MCVLLTPKLIRRDLITLPLTRSVRDMLSQSPKILKIYIYKSKLLTFRMAAWGALQTCFPVKKKNYNQ